jgi:metallo-beta-lactamase family protein
MGQLSLDFLGAAGTVTGSRTLLHYKKKQILVDCGLFQGPKPLRERNWAAFKPDPSSLDSVVLTHAHLDHSGYLPRLHKEGYKGPVFCSAGTADLCQILLLDAAHIQEEDSDYANRTRHSRHVPALPLYTKADAEEVLTQLRPCPRDEWIPSTEGLSYRFLRSGHIIGSSFVQFSAQVGEHSRLITFSGDLGRLRPRLLRPPVNILETDILVLESTYGNRMHSQKDPLEDLGSVVRRTAEREGILVIPAFAVGRAQELIYLLRQLEIKKLIPEIPVILDSPMASRATELFKLHPEDHILGTPHSGDASEFLPRHFETSESSDDSMIACMRGGPMIVITASGMLSGGRVLHHLKHRLPDPRNTLLFSGYQAEGTKGRWLQDQGKVAGSVRIHHEEVAVNAEIAILSNLSGHADSLEILEWLSAFRRPPDETFLNHGSPEASRQLAEAIRDRLGWRVTPVESEKRFELY